MHSRKMLEQKMRGELTIDEKRILCDNYCFWNKRTQVKLKAEDMQMEDLMHIYEQIRWELAKGRHGIFELACTIDAKIFLVNLFRQIWLAMYM